MFFIRWSVLHQVECSSSGGVNKSSTFAQQKAGYKKDHRIRKSGGSQGLPCVMKYNITILPDQF
jgi:hypothetical protein